MSEQNGSRDARFVVPLVIWLAVSILSLAVPALRLPLSANYPRPAESMALQVFLVSQFLVSALLFPALMQSLLFRLDGSRRMVFV